MKNIYITMKLVLVCTMSPYSLQISREKGGQYIGHVPRSLLPGITEAPRRGNSTRFDISDKQNLYLDETIPFNQNFLSLKVSPSSLTSSTDLPLFYVGATKIQGSRGMSR